MNSEFRRCLEELDVKGVQAIWAVVSSHLPQPKTEEETLITMHITRTQTESIALKKRAYSHRWLLDHGYPSLLPDKLKSKAERYYPKVVDGVGICIKTNSDLMRPIVPFVRKAMEDSVLESYEDKVVDPVLIKLQMMNARKKTIKSLLGI